MKLNNKVRLLITCDSSAGAGKTTAAKYLSKKFGLALLTSGLLYRYVAYRLMISKNKVTNEFVNKKGERFIYNQYVIFTQLKEKFENMNCFKKYKTYTSTNNLPTFVRNLEKLV